MLTIPAVSTFIDHVDTNVKSQSTDHLCPISLVFRPADELSPSIIRIHPYCRYPSASFQQVFALELWDEVTKAARVFAGHRPERFLIFAPDCPTEFFQRERAFIHVWKHSLLNSLEPPR